MVVEVGGISGSPVATMLELELAVCRVWAYFSPMVILVYGIKIRVVASDVKPFLLGAVNK